MAYFPDLSPYAYGYYAHPGVVHVGWLDGIHPFPRGHVEPHLIEKMKLLAAKPVELYRGRHLCELCVAPAELGKEFLTDRGKPVSNSLWWRWAETRMSNGEIRVTDGEVTFAAPVLIVHYIEEHGYLPPAQFLKAIEKAAIPK